MDTNTDFDPADVEAQLEQNPVSRRRLARDIAEMVQEPYPNIRFIPSQDSIVEACLHLTTKTRVIHVTLQFPANYIETGPRVAINGRAGVDELFEGEIYCADILAGMGREKQAYTLKTLAIHLLSMFDTIRDREPVKSWDHGEYWIRSKWADYSCYKCGYPLTDPDAINTHADERSISQRALPNQPMTICELPTEMLMYVLEHLEIQDIVRFGQAFDEIKSIIEKYAVIRNRELHCFVTKEHFTQSPLGIGVHSAGQRWAEFDLISQAAFRDLGVRTTAYDCGFRYWLPLPLSERHWDEVKNKVDSVLGELNRPSYEADRLGALIALMEDQAIKLFTSMEQCSDRGLLQASEKGIESLFFLLHLFLCVAVDNPEYVVKANEVIERFQAPNGHRQYMPSPGRILAALLISGVETDVNFMHRIFHEAVTRNVRQLLDKYPGLGYLEDDGAASSYRLHYTFKASLASYRALMLMDVFQRTVRPATKDITLEVARDTLFKRHGFPPSSTLAILAAELREIVAVDSFPRLCNYLGIYRDPDERFLAGKLRQAVLDATTDRGLVCWPLSQDESLVLRHEAERTSGAPLLCTEGLPSCPKQPTCLEALRKLGPWSPLYRARRGMIAELP